MRNRILIIVAALFFAAPSFGQKYSNGKQPSGWLPSRLAPHSQLRKATKPNQVLMSLGDSTLKYVDADTAATLLGNGEYKGNLFVVGKKYKSYIGNTGLENISNPAYHRQLQEARNGSDHTPFPNCNEVIDFCNDMSLHNPYIYMAADTFYSTGSSMVLGNDEINDLSILSDGVIDLTSSNFINFSGFGGENKSLRMDLNKVVFRNGGVQGLVYSFGNLNETFKHVSMNVDRVIVPSTNISAPVYNTLYGGHGIRNASINIRNYINMKPNLVRLIQGGFGDYPDNLFNIDIENITIENTLYKDANSVCILYEGCKNLTFKMGLSNVRIKGESNLPVMQYELQNDDLTIGDINGSIDSSVFKINATSIIIENDSTSSGLSNFNSPDVLYNKGGLLHIKGNTGYIKNTTIDISVDVFSSKGQQAFSTMHQYGGVILIENSTIRVRIGDGYCGDIAATLRSLSLVNSKIIIEGDVTSANKCISIKDITMDEKSSIVLKGKFKTLSDSLECIEIGSISGAGANNIIIDCQIVTGGGYCISNPSASTIYVTVTPNSYSNYSTSGDVTQVGGTITVNSNYSN